MNWNLGKDRKDEEELQEEFHKVGGNGDNIPCKGNSKCKGPGAEKHSINQEKIRMIRGGVKESMQDRTEKGKKTRSGLGEPC